MERDSMGRFVKGHKQLNSGRTHFKKGVAVRLGQKHTEDSKRKMSDAKKGIMPQNIEQLKSSHTPSGEEHCNWKGDDCGYSSLHKWVYKQLGKAQFCEVCGTDQWVEWANKSHNYKRDKGDWISLCRKHHKEYDKKHKEAF